MKKGHITPVEGVKIRNPKTKLLLPVEGQTLLVTSFWLRREAEGSVTISYEIEVKNVDII